MPEPEKSAGNDRLLPAVCPWCEHVIDHCRVVPCTAHAHLVGYHGNQPLSEAGSSTQSASAKNTDIKSACQPPHAQEIDNRQNGLTHVIHGYRGGEAIHADNCYACERKGLQERIELTKDYETLRLRAEQLEAQLSELTNDHGAELAAVPAIPDVAERVPASDCHGGWHDVPVGEVGLTPGVWQPRTDNPSICVHCGLRMFQHQYRADSEIWCVPAWRPAADGVEEQSHVAKRCEGWYYEGYRCGMTNGHLGDCGPQSSHSRRRQQG